MANQLNNARDYAARDAELYLDALTRGCERLDCIICYDGLVNVFRTVKDSVKRLCYCLEGVAACLSYAGTRWILIRQQLYSAHCACASIWLWLRSSTMPLAAAADDAGAAAARNCCC